MSTIIKIVLYACLVASSWSVDVFVVTNEHIYAYVLVRMVATVINYT